MTTIKYYLKYNTNLDDTYEFDDDVIHNTLNFSKIDPANFCLCSDSLFRKDPTFSTNLISKKYLFLSGEKILKDGNINLNLNLIINDTNITRVFSSIDNHFTKLFGTLFYVPFCTKSVVLFNLCHYIMNDPNYICQVINNLTKLQVTYYNMYELVDIIESAKSIRLVFKICGLDSFGKIKIVVNQIYYE